MFTAHLAKLYGNPTYGNYSKSLVRTVINYKQIFRKSKYSKYLIRVGKTLLSSASLISGSMVCVCVCMFNSLDIPDDTQ